MIEDNQEPVHALIQQACAQGRTVKVHIPAVPGHVPAVQWKVVITPSTVSLWDKEPGNQKTMRGSIEGLRYFQSRFGVPRVNLRLPL